MLTGVGDAVSLPSRLVGRGFSYRFVLNLSKVVWFLSIFVGVYLGVFLTDTFLELALEPLLSKI